MTEGYIFGISHIVVEKGTGVYSEGGGQILGVSHNIIVVEESGIFREGGVDSGRVAHSC